MPESSSTKPRAEQTQRCGEVKQREATFLRTFMTESLRFTSSLSATPRAASAPVGIPRYHVLLTASPRRPSMVISRLLRRRQTIRSETRRGREERYQCSDDRHRWRTACPKDRADFQ